jgi:hypothetical protein
MYIIIIFFADNRTPSPNRIKQEAFLSSTQREGRLRETRRQGGRITACITCQGNAVVDYSSLYQEPFILQFHNHRTLSHWHNTRIYVPAQRKDINIEHRASKAARLSSWRKMTQPGEFCW